MIKVCALMYSVALATFYPIVLDLFLSKKKENKKWKMVQRFSSIHDLVQGRVALKDVRSSPFYHDAIL